MVESLTYKYINGNLAQEYAANWKVESQNLPSGSTLETSEVPSQLTITVPANNTSSTRSGKIVLLQPAGGVIQVPQNTWADNGGDTAIYTLYLKGSEIKAGSTFYFQCRFYAINGWEGLLVDLEYNKALNYKIDTVQPSWNPSGTIQSGTIYLYKGNLSPSDFSGGILIELTLGTEINGYVKKAMIRVKVN